MTSDSSQPDQHDQDAEPPTPDGEEPDAVGFESDDPTPGSHPDPPPEGDDGGHAGT